MVRYGRIQQILLNERYMMIQLPNDVKTVSQRMLSNYTVETVYYSPSNDFQGTEEEFVAAGLAYKYIQIDKFTRVGEKF